MTDENMQEHCQLTVGQTSPNPPAPEEQTSGSVTLCQSANKKKGEMRERAGKRRNPFNERQRSYLKLQEKHERINEKILKNLTEKHDMEVKTLESIAAMCNAVVTMGGKVMEYIDATKH